MRGELGVPPDDLLVVTVANLRSEKGYDVLLDAAGLLVARGTPVRFAAAGQGVEADALAARHRRLGLGERFRFLGYRNDTLELMLAADIVVLPSHQEGLPRRADGGVAAWAPRSWPPRSGVCPSWSSTA